MNGRNPTETSATTLRFKVVSASNTVVDLLTVQYAKAFPKIRINAVAPGYTKTDLGSP